MTLLFSPCFSLQIKTLGQDGSILKNQELILVSEAENKQSNQILITDSTGVATFTLDTAVWNGSDVSLEVSGLKCSAVKYLTQEAEEIWRMAYKVPLGQAVGFPLLCFLGPVTCLGGC